jgi:mono/diheme cytochrome c family protein
LYYIDVFGNKELIHRDPVLSVWYPVALKKRALPPVIPDSPGNVEYAETYVTNVYQGMEDVQPGEIKYIRIGHHTEWPAAQIDDQPHNYNHYHYTPSGSWSRTLGMSTWSPARVIGTVPVEEDGSAYFKVPANVPVYFQVLDENMLEVRRMRSFITYGKGKTRGCTGCHETRDEAPMGLTYMPKALKRTPSQPEPPTWGDTTLPDYEAHIHPIFENNCAGCHGAEDPAAGLEFSSRRVDGYYQAYRTLFGLKAEKPTPVHELHAWEITFGDHHNVVVDKDALVKMERNEYPGQLVTISNKFGDASVTKVREFGSGNSKLIDVLMSEKHKKHVQLSDQDWQDLVTWIDLNAPYWGSFIDKEPVRKGGKPKRVTVKFGEPFAEQVKK